MQNLGTSVTSLPTFNLSELNLPSDIDFELPTNLRLGHLVEKVVSELIKLSTNYRLLYENIQLVENNKTIGEIDFILKDENTNRLIHLELAYKFYLFDPNISSKPINNWIGPNRNDSLKEKLEKVKSKQFPLLYHPVAVSKFNDLTLEKITQALCLLVSLFIPYDYKTNLDPAYEKAIKGYYLNVDEFISLDHTDKTYYFPTKSEWGIDPSENETWDNFKNIEAKMMTSINQKKALLCWQNDKDAYASFFIVWW